MVDFLNELAFSLMKLSKKTDAAPMAVLTVNLIKSISFTQGKRSCRHFGGSSTTGTVQ